MQSLSSAARSPTGPQSAQVAPPRTLPSADLLQGSRSVEINHNGAVYRLQATRLGKLILTK
ncbi:MAG: hemin uptake protein HemP [Ramlibacter sp.]